MPKNIFFQSSFFLICLLSSILIVSNISFLLGYELSVYVFLISFIIDIILMFCAFDKTKDILFSIFLATIITIICYYLAISFYDTSWDGQGYHQESMYLIKNGWNPVYEQSKAFRIWVGLYQKGNEIIQANIYLLTNKIEAGKMVNIIFVYCTFFIILNFLNTLKINSLYKFIISFITVFNPVVFTQVFTYYVDGNWYLILLISLSSLLTYFSTKKLQSLLVFVLSSVLFCSLKFSSIPVFIVFSFFVFLYYYCQKKIIIAPYLSIFLFFVICNVNPFITNIKKGVHIFHPFVGEKKIDIINQNIPEILLNKNRLERTLISLFSETSNDKKVEFPKNLKFPFMVNRDELFINYDERLGGFGFFFSGIIVVSFLIAIFLLLKSDKEHRKKLFFILSAILMSILINPASWWARLSSQIWLIPIIIIIFGLITESRVSLKLSQFALILFFVNILIPGCLTIIKLRNDNNEMKTFVNSVGDKTITLDLSNRYGFQQYYVKFKEKHIKYKISKINNHYKLAPSTPDVYYEIN